MTKMKLYFESISVGLLSIIVFLISNSHQFITPFIILWVMSTIALIFVEKSKFRINKSLIGLISFYVLLILGIIWTDNMTAGTFDLEVKMSLIIFPVIFMFKDYEFKSLKWVIMSFVMGLLFSSLFLLFQGAGRFLDGAGYDTFLYANLSHSIHPTYMSLYYSTGIIVLLLDLKRQRFFKRKWLTILLLCYFYGYNLVLLSKAGIISISLFLFVFITIWSIKNRKIFYPLALAFAFSFLLLLSYQKSKLVKHRVDELIHGVASVSGEKSNGSTGIRVRIWGEGISLIKEKPLVGYGTGDVKDVLMKRYDDVRMCTAYDNKLNAHNQFIQIALSIGLIGLFIFCMTMYESIKNGIKNNNLFIVSFVIMFIAYALTESLLENQAGTIFFGLFFSLLNQKTFFTHE